MGGGGGGGGVEVSWELGQPPGKMCFIAVETLQIVAARCGPMHCKGKKQAKFLPENSVHATKQADRMTTYKWLVMF